MTYDSVTRNLTDIQNYCSLRKIAALVKDAIGAAANSGQEQVDRRHPRLRWSLHLRG